jgi:hypothetical protein
VAGERDRDLGSLVVRFIQRMMAGALRPRRTLPRADTLLKRCGLPRERVRFAWAGRVSEPRLRVTATAVRSLDLDLLVWKRDSRLGDPELRVALPKPMARAYHATSREPLLSARLFTDEIADELVLLASSAETVRLVDESLRLEFAFEESGWEGSEQRILGAARTALSVLDQLEARRRLLPRSDYAPALERSWRHFAAQHGASFDERAETLSLMTPFGELDVRVADFGRRRSTLLELHFDSKLPFAFELCEKSELGWLERLRSPLISDPERSVALYVSGNGETAREALTPAAERALADLRAASSAVHVSNGALMCRTADVLTDELERSVELMLRAGEALSTRARHSAGPYR